MELFTNRVPLSVDTTALYGKRTLKQTLRFNTTIAQFRRSFAAKSCYIASAPGRVEVIGNHTDHNGGSVIGCTINLDIIAAFLPTDNNVVHIKNKGRPDIVFNLSEIDNVHSGSHGMVRGVLAYLKQRGANIGGFNAVFDSCVPVGAGLSSGAAFQLLVGTIQSALYNDNSLSAEVLARAGQYAENVYFGKPCGLLDEGVVAVGGVVAIEFADGFVYRKYAPILSDYDMVVVNTGKSHASLTEHYAAIPAEMKAVAAHFGATRLVDVNPQHFFGDYNNIVRCVGQRPALRAKHFFEECNRVSLAEQALASRDQSLLLQLVRQSGESSLTQLQNCGVDGDTTIADALAYAAKICPDGAYRVHGGGFAGTILCIVPKAQTLRFCVDMSAKYGVKNVFKVSPRSVGSCVL